jgi:hypothetical protein
MHLISFFLAPFPCLLSGNIPYLRICHLYTYFSIHLCHSLMFHVQVKIIKCLVENIVVDISFNQVGGLCTLCFLEEVCSYFPNPA